MEAHTMYRESNIDGALLMYTQLAELGYEVAQSNVAFILDQGLGILCTSATGNLLLSLLTCLIAPLILDHLREITS